MPRLTYAYNVARLTPNSAAARRASRYRASPTPDLLLLRFLLPKRYLMLIHKSILIIILKPTTITTKVRYGPPNLKEGHMNEESGIVFASGLEGVIAAETRLSEVDGEAGELIIAG